MRLRTTLLALALGVGVTVAGCGTENAAGSGEAAATPAASATTADHDADHADHNDADVAFVQEMIPHHWQAVQMARMARTHASSPEVRRLAAHIRSAQAAEIRTMRGWLEEWGEDDPWDAMGHGAHGMGSAHGMDADGMSGMMDDADLDDLDAHQGSSWDRMFLTMMIPHHEGAIEMATAEKDQGENPDVLALASRIITGQQAEIETMRRLLG